MAADAPADFCTTSVPQEELEIGKLSSIFPDAFNFPKFGGGDSVHPPMLLEDDLSISEDRPLLFELVDESHDGFPHTGGIIITLLMRSCLPRSQLSRAAA